MSARLTLQDAVTVFPSQYPEGVFIAPHVVAEPLALQERGALHVGGLHVREDIARVVEQNEKKQLWDCDPRTFCRCFPIRAPASNTPHPAP